MEAIEVVDSDAHVVEPPDLWRKYIEPKFLGREPVHDDARRGTFGVFVEGRGINSWDMREAEQPVEQRRAAADRLHTYFTTRFARAFAAGFDAESYLADMDRQGVSVSVLYPSYGNYAIAADWIEPELAAAIARAYNNWLADYCAAAPDRLKGVALVALQDPQAAADEARRAIGELGLVGAMARPNPVHGRNLSDPAYFPLYATLEALGAPLAIHEGGRPGLPQAGADRYPRGQQRHICSHPMEQMLAALGLITGGVLERYPGLRVAFLESGAGWAPYWLWRMDEHWESSGESGMADGSAPLPQRPSDYFRRQCFISAEPDEPFVRPTIDYLGEDAVIFATDYPHPDSKFPDAVRNFLELPGLSERTRQRILWENPRRLYGLAGGG